MCTDTCSKESSHDKREFQFEPGSSIVSWLQSSAPGSAWQFHARELFCEVAANAYRLPEFEVPLQPPRRFEFTLITGSVMIANGMNQKHRSLGPGTAVLGLQFKPRPVETV